MVNLQTASTAANVFMPFVISTASTTRSIEAVAKANGGGNRWYQPYSSGLHALVVTLDTSLLGWHSHEHDTAHLPFIAGFGVQVGMSDPVFMQRMCGGGLADERPAFALDFDAFRTACAGERAGSRCVYAWHRVIARGQLVLSACGRTSRFFRENWDGYTVSCSKAPRRSRTPAGTDVSVDGIIVRTMGAGGRRVDLSNSPLATLRLEAHALTTYYLQGQRQQQSANSVAIPTEFPQNFPLSTPKGHFAFREDRECEDVQARGC
ncbi:hypothetical protein DFH94DRAFT_683099 [Russula ochroleuca]|uniref:Uncharacterized protein n=1 Tax=Russula ochroleuca TaxID=152965 RepID=A0A9P5T7A4_9AGAM|nr:hypothetical protein DFH94DRAFT_683099 [Russula ochroleuca]